MAVHTLDLDCLSVVVYDLTFDFDLSDTHVILEMLEFLSLAAEGNVYIIKIRLFRGPERRLVHDDLKFETVLYSCIDLLDAA